MLCINTHLHMVRVITSRPPPSLSLNITRWVNPSTPCFLLFWRYNTNSRVGTYLHSPDIPRRKKTTTDETTNWAGFKVSPYRAITRTEEYLFIPLSSGAKMSKILVKQSQSPPPPPYGPSESKCLWDRSIMVTEWRNGPAEGQETGNEDIMKDVSILILDLLYIGPTFPLLGNLLHHLVPHSSLAQPIIPSVCWSALALNLLDDYRWWVVHQCPNWCSFWCCSWFPPVVRETVSVSPDWFW